MYRTLFDATIESFTANQMEEFSMLLHFSSCYKRVKMKFIDHCNHCLLSESLCDTYGNGESCSN